MMMTLRKIRDNKRNRVYASLLYEPLFRKKNYRLINRKNNTLRMSEENKFNPALVKRYSGSVSVQDELLKILFIYLFI